MLPDQLWLIEGVSQEGCVRRVCGVQAEAQAAKSRCGTEVEKGVDEAFLRTPVLFFEPGGILRART